MNSSAYFQEVKNLKENIYKTSFTEVENNIGLFGLYMTVSANLSTFLPQFSSESHYRTIQTIQFHRALSNIDQYHLSLLKNLKIIDKSDILEKCEGVGHIFVTYHTGSYRMFIKHLMKKNISFCLVTEERFKKEQGKIVQKIFNEIRGPLSGELEILPAENPKLIFELTRRLKKGISVVFYIDGNTGVSEKKLEENSNLLKINFLNHHIYARQGIAFLAYLSKSPIAIAIAKRNKNLSNTIRIKPIETTNLIQKNNRNSFIKIVTQKLYRQLELFLKRTPEQWEGWFYIDKFFKKPSQDNLSGNKKAYNFTKPITLVIEPFIHLLKYDENCAFLINKSSYQVMEITNALYKILNFFKNPKEIIPSKILIIDNQRVDEKFITELIGMNFLKSV